MKAGLASASVEGLWIINSRGVTVYANEGMAKILGVADASSLIGKDSFQYVFPDDLDAARDLFVEKEAGNRSPFHFRLRRADYVEIWVGAGYSDAQRRGRFHWDCGLVRCLKPAGEEVD